MLETIKHVPVKYQMPPEIRKIIKETDDYGNCYFDWGVFYNNKPWKSTK